MYRSGRSRAELQTRAFAVAAAEPNTTFKDSEGGAVRRPAEMDRYDRTAQ
jgi:hypothetical protein